MRLEGDDRAIDGCGVVGSHPLVVSPNMVELQGSLEEAIKGTGVGGQSTEVCLVLRDSLRKSKVSAGRNDAEDGLERHGAVFSVADVDVVQKVWVMTSDSLDAGVVEESLRLLKSLGVAIAADFGADGCCVPGRRRWGSTLVPVLGSSWAKRGATLRQEGWRRHGVEFELAHFIHALGLVLGVVGGCGVLRSLKFRVVD